MGAIDVHLLSLSAICEITVEEQKERLHFEVKDLRYGLIFTIVHV